MLDVPVPITLRYDLVEMTSDSVRVYPDIYHLSSKGLHDDVRRALERAGVDTQLVDDARIRTFVNRLGSGSRATALATLLRAHRDSSDRKSGAPLTDRRAAHR